MQLLDLGRAGRDAFPPPSPFEDPFGSKTHAWALFYQPRATRDRRFASFPLPLHTCYRLTATDGAQKNSTLHHSEHPLLVTLLHTIRIPSRHYITGYVIAATSNCQGLDFYLMYDIHAYPNPQCSTIREISGSVDWGRRERGRLSRRWLLNLDVGNHFGAGMVLAAAAVAYMTLSPLFIPVGNAYFIQDIPPSRLPPRSLRESLSKALGQGMGCA